jgi:hypothetical protein
LEAEKDELKKQLELVNQEVSFFTKNKELIKEAVEFHLNFASSFLSQHSNPHLLNTLDELKEVTLLMGELDEKIKKLADEYEIFSEEEGKKEVKKKLEEAKTERGKLSNQLNHLKKLLDPNNPTIQAFQNQKAKNERIVKESKELLDKLPKEE